MSATVASGRVFDAFLGDDLGPRTLYHGHSYGGNALAAAVALRHLELIDAWDVLANVRERSDELRDAARTTASRRSRRCARSGCRASWAASSSRRRADGLRWGRRCRRARNRSRRAAAPARRHRRADAAAHDHLARGPPHRRRARRRDRRGHCDGDVARRGPTANAARSERRGPLAGAARPRRARARGRSPADGRRSSRSRRTTTSGSRNIRRSSPPPTTRSTAGARARARPG